MSYELALANRIRAIERELEQLKTLDPGASRAYADGLESPVKIIAVKSAVFTGTQAASVAAGASFAITDLEITHTLAKSTNKILLMGEIGVSASSGEGGGVGTAFSVDGSLILIGTAGGNRTRVAAGSHPSLVDEGDYISNQHSISGIYEPESASSLVYRLNALNPSTVTRTIYINHFSTDTDISGRMRGVSSLILIEMEE